MLTAGVVPAALQLRSTSSERSLQAISRPRSLLAFLFAFFSLSPLF